MNTDQLKKQVLDEAERNGITLTEDELNAKVLEVSRMDTEMLERLSGGGALLNCTRTYWCWSDFMCVSWSKGREDK